jgi:hypothetical protein
LAPASSAARAVEAAFALLALENCIAVEVIDGSAGPASRLIAADCSRRAVRIAFCVCPAAGLTEAYLENAAAPSAPAGSCALIAVGKSESRATCAIGPWGIVSGLAGESFGIAPWVVAVSPVQIVARLSANARHWPSAQSELIAWRTVIWKLP